MMLYFGYQGAQFQITYAIALFPFMILIMAFLGLGLGLIITALTTKYRDLSFLVTFGVQLLMYGTTIIYPLSMAPEKYRKFIELNPMTGIIEAFRFAFLGKGYFTVWSLGYSAIFTLVITMIGIIIFNKTERSFIDTI
jgi:lipopolysaccharide transport system permease protein